MTNMDYNVANSPTAMVLNKVLSSDNVVVRHRAMKHLQVYFILIRYLYINFRKIIR